MATKFVSKKQIPPRKTSGERKYAKLYADLKKHPGEWAEVTSTIKATLSASNDGVRTYPDVRTMTRGDRHFAAYQKPAGKKPAKRKAGRK